MSSGVMVDWIVADSVFGGTSLSVGGESKTVSVSDVMVEGRCRESEAEERGVTVESVDEVCLVGFVVMMIVVGLRTSEV